MAKCVYCDSDLATGKTDYCDVCGKLQASDFCKTCLKRIPGNARVCNACKSYQSGCLRRFLLAGTVLGPLFTALAIFSGTWALYKGFHRDSLTAFRVASATEQSIVIKVWNSGVDPSSLLHYRLTFPGVAIEPLELTASSDEEMAATPVVWGGSVPVVLEVSTTQELDAKSEDAFAHLQDHPITMEIEVRESNDPGWFGFHKYHTREDTFDAKLISAFLEKRKPRHR